MGVDGQDEEGAVVEVGLAERLVGRSAGVDGDPVGLDAIGCRAVFPDAADKEAEGGFDVPRGEEVAGVLDHVGEVAGPEGAVVALAVGGVEPGAVVGADAGSGEERAGGLLEPGDGGGEIRAGGGRRGFEAGSQGGGGGQGGQGEGGGEGADAVHGQ